MDIPDNVFETLSWKAFALAVLNKLSGSPHFLVGPKMPEDLVTGAFASYVALGENETLLAIRSSPNSLDHAPTFALTSHRIILAAPVDYSTQNSTHLADSRQPNDLSVAYKDLAATIEVSGLFVPKLLLDQKLIPIPKGCSTAELKLLRDALKTLRDGALSDTPETLISPEALAQGRRDMATLIAITPQSQPFIPSAVTQVARPKPPSPIVTRVLILACLVVYGLMVSRGVSPVAPTAEQLYYWGGGQGEAVALDHEYWRLITPMFLHGGLIHLALNMLCLWQLGRLVETLYGRFGMVMIYLIAGVSGSIASAWWNPEVIGVGASGAIFGLIGAVITFLTIHRRKIPIKALKSIRSGMFAFIMYNLLPGVFIKQIDNAAHLGGLVGGLFAGVCLMRPWPVASPRHGLGKQLVIALVPIAVLSWGAMALVRTLPAHLSAEAIEMRVSRDKARELADFGEKLAPVLHKYNASLDIQSRLLKDMKTINLNISAVNENVRQVFSNLDDVDLDLRKIVLTDPEIIDLRAALIDSSRSLRLMTKRLQQGFADPESTPTSGPDSFQSLRKANDEAMARFETLQKEFIAKYKLK